MKTKTLKHLIASIAFAFTFINAFSQSCTQCDNSGNPLGTYASAIGQNTTASGVYSFAGGINSSASGGVSFAFGQSAIASSSLSFAMGASAISSNSDAFAFGSFCNASGTSSFVLGNGLNSSTILNNSVGYSLMIGFNSDKPTFFVGGSSGAGKTGRIGIGNVTDPLAKLHIKGDDNENADLLLEPGVNKYAKIKFGNSGNRIEAKADFDLNFRTNYDFVFWDGNVGIGTTAPKAKLQIADGDIFIADIDRGIIMKSPDGQCWRGTLDNSGNLIFEAVDCNLTTLNPEQENEPSSRVVVYPNPAKASITIKLSGYHEALNLQFFDMSGNLVLAREMRGQTMKIKTQPLKSGNYLIKITDQYGKLIHSEKTIVQ